MFYFHLLPIITDYYHLLPILASPNWSSKYKNIFLFFNFNLFNFSLSFDHTDYTNYTNNTLHTIPILSRDLPLDSRLLDHLRVLSCTTPLPWRGPRSLAFAIQLDPLRQSHFFTELLVNLLVTDFFCTFGPGQRHYTEQHQTKSKPKKTLSRIGGSPSCHKSANQIFVIFNSYSF